MRLKVKNFDEEHNLICGHERDTYDECRVDCFVGCAFEMEERKDIHKFIKVGDLIEIPDDIQVYRPFYLAGENQIKVIKEDKHETHN